MRTPKFWPCLAVAVSLGLAPILAQAAPRLPIEDFAREPEAARARLSPNGKYVAFLRPYVGRSMLFVDEIDGKGLVRLDPGEAQLVQGAPKEVVDFQWVSDRRLIITTSVWGAIYGTVAVDRDGRRRVPISGLEDEKMNLQESRLYFYETIARNFSADPMVLMLDRHEATPGSFTRPDVYRINTDVGGGALVAKNPGEVASWAADAKGVVRVGFTSHGALSGVIYREAEDKPWTTLLPLEARPGRMAPVGYDAARNVLFVTSLNATKRRALCTFDLQTKTTSEPILSDPEYDVLPRSSPTAIDGLRLHEAIFSPKDRSLLGLRYFTEAPRVKWFNRSFQEQQRGMDRALPNTVNIPVDLSQDEKRMLWFAFSDQDPGTYYLFDFEKRSLTSIAARMNWIKPAQMSPMLSVKYAARDGLIVHGYLTVPVGHPPKNLPLVVLPHGGPWVRDVWVFDPLVQLLASRGYAVLQMNYRGSVGYGEELYDAAQKEIGGKIQDDIEDAARWAVAAGVADPKRMAIVGASYGGYSALFALGKNPDLYRCGVSIAGVTDWMDIFGDRKHDSDYRAANAHWRQQIGDPETEAERLRAVSPVSFADKILAPVLIIQGKDDRIVPPRQARLMIDALEKAGHPPESLFVPNQGHSLAGSKGRLAIFQALVAFLEKNLGPGVEFTPPQGK